MPRVNKPGLWEHEAKDVQRPLFQTLRRALLQRPVLEHSTNGSTIGCGIRAQVGLSTVQFPARQSEEGEKRVSPCGYALHIQLLEAHKAKRRDQQVLIGAWGVTQSQLQQLKSKRPKASRKRKRTSATIKMPNICKRALLTQFLKAIDRMNSRETYRSWKLRSSGYQKRKGLFRSSVESELTGKWTNKDSLKWEAFTVKDKDETV